MSVKIKTDEDTFLKMLEASRIKILWSVCKVYEDIRILNCYKCSRFDHTEDNCLSAVDICSNCAGKHKSNICMGVSAEKCINCVERNAKLNINELTNHAAHSFKCPILNKKFQQLQKRTFYSK